MAKPLMPKATAVWLLDNTSLTFDQISTYCELHTLEVQAIADGEVAPGMQGLDPIINGQLTLDEISKCETDNSRHLEMSTPTVPLPKARQKGARYTPISKRQDRPDAISWLLRNYPELSDAQISRLIGTTKNTINSVRDKTHRNMANIAPQSPIYLGLCSASDLEKSVRKARSKIENYSQKKNPPTSSEISEPEKNLTDHTAEQTSLDPILEKKQPSPTHNTPSSDPTIEDVFGPSLSEQND